MAGRVGSIPTRSRHLPRHTHCFHTRWILGSAVAVATTLAPCVGLAQSRDRAQSGIGGPSLAEPAAAGARAPFATSGRAERRAGVRARPPVSPKSAFLYSLLLPGLGQAKLDRGYAGALFFSVEAVAFEQLRQAQLDLQYAQHHAHDSTLVVQTYQVDSLGRPLRDSTGKLIPGTYGYARYDSTRVAARRTHAEDWIAVLLFNHLISGADAFVAAQLWDLPAHVRPTVRQTADGRRLIGAEVSW